MRNKNLLHILVALALLCLTLFSSGCVLDRYHSSDGTKNVSFSRFALGNKQTTKSLDIDLGTGKVGMKGYANDQTETTAAVAQAVADAVSRAVAPKP